MSHLGWIVVFILVPLMAVVTAGHALLHKRDPRAAFGWVAVCFFFPVAGPILYFLFGVNRVSTRAKKLKHRSPFYFHINYPRTDDTKRGAASPTQLLSQLAEITKTSDAVTRRPLVSGNHIEMLHNGEQAFPAMLQTIDQAERYIFLASYILETNETGRKFIDALGRAAARGVDVRVLIDGVGELYSLPLAGWLLKKSGVRHVRFLPPRLFPPSMFINLRNHRKILVVDGREGYAGGMNIGDRHLTANVRNRARVADIHFKFTGPVVSQMEEIFLEDWGFCTGEHLQPRPQIPAVADGGAVCRAVADGPNEDLDKLATILLGGIVAARQEILIMTPYFLPSREMISALQVAALRGVKVHIILPARNNQPIVHWATRNMLWQLLRHKIRIYYQPPPFAHTKLLVIDSRYGLVGSANIDPRSLRLNFEFAVEIGDVRFGATLAAYFEEIRKQSRETTLAEMDKRSLLIRIRDALAWLFSPYL